MFSQKTLYEREKILVSHSSSLFPLVSGSALFCMVEKSHQSYAPDPASFENCFVILQLLKVKDESKNMDVFVMRIIKVERQAQALEEN